MRAKAQGAPTPPGVPNRPTSAHRLSYNDLDDTRPTAAATRQTASRSDAPIWMAPGKLEGWLEKQGGLRKNWTRRYFKQAGAPGSALSYYADGPAMKDCKGTIELGGASELVPCADKPCM